MRHIVSISFTQVGDNLDQVIIFKGEKVRLTRFCTEFDEELTINLIKRYDGLCDAICLSGMPPKIKVLKSSFIHPLTLKLKKVAKETPVFDGQLIKDIYIPWGIRQFYLKNRSLFSGKKIGFYSASLQKSMSQTFEELGNELIFSDPYFFLKMPFNIYSNKKLETFISFLSPILKKMTIKRSNVAHYDNTLLDIAPHLREFYGSDIFCANASTLSLLHFAHLKGKTVVLDYLNNELEERLKKAGVSKIIVCMPNIVESKHIDYSTLEGLFHVSKNDSKKLSEQDILNIMNEFDLGPQLKVYEKIKKVDEVTKYAFIIHPLSAKMLFKHPALRPFKKLLNPFEKVAEDMLAYGPGFYYGKIEGVRSEATGKEVEGLIYTVTETPKKLLEKDPESVYKKLVNLSKLASQSGAKIIGLGAYTKIVGDAGITVNKRSPIPVTTGNSLSATSTLWAAKLAVEKMGFVKWDENSIIEGTVMIVGATGSIGSVSAKVLSQKWENVILVAPRAYKLMELKQEIEWLSPDCNIKISTTPAEFISECDLVITTTSNRGKKVLDILDVKPGAVICDVSRPFDISEEDALARPDVMVIASGEVQLPGEVKSKIDLGLEGNIVYACLAETALLAMEEKFESFTLSRNIDFENVLEIDRLAKKHGVRLASIMGHAGFVTDEEFELCRNHALEKIKQLKE